MSHPKDLIVLAADLDIENAVKGILARPRSMNIRTVDFRIIRHPMRDPGCCRSAHHILRLYQQTCAHALVIFDREGSGRESDPRDVIEQDVEQALRSVGWGDRAAAVVIDPELEAWVWSTSPEVDRVLGWSAMVPSLRDQLREQGYMPAAGKPDRPKEALDWALREVRKPRSARIFYDLARAVSPVRCRDVSFHKLRKTLQTWFPPGNE